MSAINPASFVTPPTAGLPPPGGVANADGRVYGAARDGMDVGRDTVGNKIGPLRSTYIDPYQSFPHGARQPESGLGELAPSADPFSPYPPNAYGGTLDTSYVDYAAHSPGVGSGPSRVHNAPNDWTTRFQGLSLGS